MRFIRVFLLGLLVGIGSTLAVTQGKVGFARTEEGFKITCKASFLDGNPRELARQAADFAARTWEKYR